MGALERLLLRGLHPIAPIYRREVRRGVYPFRAEKLWPGCLALAALLVLILMIGPLSVVALMITSLPLFGWAWRLQMALAASSTIAREVESGTWDDLRALPWSIGEIVRSKYAAVLARERRLFTQYMTLRFFLLLAMLGFAWLAFWFDWMLAPEARANLAWMLLATVLSVGYTLFEPALDLATDGAFGLLASAFARNQGQAAGLGLALSAIGLAAQLALTALLIGGATQVAPGAGSPLQLWDSALLSLWGMAVWGPGGALLYNVSPIACAAVIALAALARTAALCGLLALAVWRAAAR